MANPTTYFGWVMPTSSSLVTNLPADFNTFGQGVDTSLQDLLGGTTGQVLSKTSNTNMDFTWVTPTDQTPLTTKGDIFAFSTVDARLPAGANETRLVADSAQTLGLKYVADTTNYAIAAKGDLLAGTAADTLTALSVGTNGQTLVADSSTATGLKWAAAASGGGMTLLSTTTLSGISTSITVSSNSYNELWVYGYGISPSAELDMIVRFNGNTGSTDYVNNSNWSQGGTGGTYYGANNGIYLNSVGSGGWGSGLTDNTFVMRIPYCNSTKRKIVTVTSQYNQGASTKAVNSNTAMAAAATTAIASIQVAVPSGTINAGTVLVYGVL